MASPSVALLSALVSATARPKRLLVPADAPSFVSNVMTITGARLMNPALSDVARTFTALAAEAIAPTETWAVAAHHSGKLASPEWLSACASRGAFTIELCAGSLRALTSADRSAATFTIVDLDAEPGLSGVGLAALLTDDDGLARRIRQLCLPRSPSDNYVLDAAPRGLAADEGVLDRLLERLGEGAEGFWVSAKTEAESSHASLQSLFDQQTTRADEWRRRFEEQQIANASLSAASEAARSESLKDQEELVEALTKSEARFRRGQSESDQALEAMRSENALLAQALESAGKERNLAVREAAAREDALRAAVVAEETRAQEFEREVGELTSFATRAAREWRSSKTEFTETIARLEGGATAADATRRGLLTRISESERSLASGAAVAATLTAALAAAQMREQDHQTALAKQSALGEELARDVAARSEREALQLRAMAEGAQERVDLLSRQSELEHEMAALQKERKDLLADRASSRRDHERTNLEASKRQESLRLALESEQTRGGQLEREVADLNEREASALKASAAVQRDLSDRIARLEETIAIAKVAHADLASEKAASDRALAAKSAERESLSKGLLEVERLRDEALSESAKRLESERADLASALKRLESEQTALAAIEKKLESVNAESVEASKRAETQRLALEAERQRVDQLEKSTAVISVREVRQAREWEVSRMEMSDRITRLEAAIVTAENAHTDVVREKAASEQAAASERDSLSKRLQEVERSRAESLAEAAKQLESERANLNAALKRVESEHASLVETQTRLEGAKAKLAEAKKRDESQRLVLEGERTRSGQLEREVAVVGEREAAARKEWAASGSEMSDRIARLEATIVKRENAATAERESSSKTLLDVERLRDEALSESAKRLESERADLASALKRLESEQTARAAIDKKLESAIAESVEASKREETQRLALEAERQRVDQLEKSTTVISVREVRQAREWEVSRMEMSDRITRLEAAIVTAENAHTDLTREKEASEQALAAAASAGESLSKRLQEVERSREESLAEAARRLESEHAELTAALKRVESEHASLIETERSLESAKAKFEEVVKREESQRLLLEKERTRGGQLEKEVADLNEREASALKASAAVQRDLSDRIARLEETIATAKVAHADLASEKAASDRALAAKSAERESLSKGFAEVERLRDEALSESAKRLESERADLASALKRLESEQAARAAIEKKLESAIAESVEASKREETQRLALEAERQRVDQLEKSTAVISVREVRQAREWEVSRVEMSDRITQLEAAIVAAENAHADVAREKEASEQALAAAASASESLSTRLQEVERSREASLAEAARRIESEHAELTAALKRVESEHASLIEAEKREASVSLARLSLSERLDEMIQDAAAQKATEAALAGQWQATQADLTARIARMEADEVVADKARTELLVRKREAERAAAQMQAEKEALARRFGGVEKARDRAQNVAARYEAAREELIAQGAGPQEWKTRFARPFESEEPQRTTGPLSVLVERLPAGAADSSFRGRGFRIQEPPPGSMADPPPSVSIDHLLSPDAPAPDALPPDADARPPSLSPLPSPPPSVETPTPLDGEPAATSEGLKENKAAGSWLHGIASRIRGRS